MAAHDAWVLQACMMSLTNQDGASDDPGHAVLAGMAWQDDLGESNVRCKDISKFLAVWHALYLGLWTEACHLIIILCYSYLWQETLGTTHMRFFMLSRCCITILHTYNFPDTVPQGLRWPTKPRDVSPLPGMCRRP